MVEFKFPRRRQWHPTPVLLPGKSHGRRSLVGCSPWGREESERLHFHFSALEKEMATHSSVLAWRIPETREPSGLPSMGLHRVGHDWSDLAAAAAVLHDLAPTSPATLLFSKQHSYLDFLQWILKWLHVSEASCFPSSVSSICNVTYNFLSKAVGSSNIIS